MKVVLFVLLLQRLCGHVCALDTDRHNREHRCVPLLYTDLMLVQARQSSDAY